MNFFSSLLGLELDAASEIEPRPGSDEFAVVLEDEPDMRIATDAALNRSLLGNQEGACRNEINVHKCVSLGGMCELRVVREGDSCFCSTQEQLPGIEVNPRAGMIGAGIGIHVNVVCRYYGFQERGAEICSTLNAAADQDLIRFWVTLLV